MSIFPDFLWVAVIFVIFTTLRSILINSNNKSSTYSQLVTSAAMTVFGFNKDIYYIVLQAYFLLIVMTINFKIC